MESRNEKRAAVSRSIPSKRAVAIVIPDRLIPGVMANALHDTDEESVDPRHPGCITPSIASQSRQQQYGSGHDQHEPDETHGAEESLESVLEGDSNHRCRDRADDDQECEAKAGVRLQRLLP